MRGSRPVLRGIEGEIPSVYLPLKIRVFTCVRSLVFVPSSAITDRHSLKDKVTGAGTTYNGSTTYVTKLSFCAIALQINLLKKFGHSLS